VHGDVHLAIRGGLDGPGAAGLQLDSAHAVGKWADSRDGQKVLVNLIKRTVTRV
jgi:hypothetical protein